METSLRKGVLTRSVTDSPIPFESPKPSSPRVNELIKHFEYLSDESVSPRIETGTLITKVKERLATTRDVPSFPKKKRSKSGSRNSSEIKKRINEEQRCLSTNPKVSKDFSLHTIRMDPSVILGVSPHEIITAEYNTITINGVTSLKPMNIAEYCNLFLLIHNAMGLRSKYLDSLYERADHFFNNKTNGVLTESDRLALGKMYTQFFILQSINSIIIKLPFDLGDQVSIDYNIIIFPEVVYSERNMKFKLGNAKLTVKFSRDRRILTPVECKLELLSVNSIELLKLLKNA